MMLKFLISEEKLWMKSPHIFERNGFNLKTTENTHQQFSKRQALAPLGTDENKPFLETAPYLIAIFAKVYGIDEQGKRVKHYYVNESVGIATGLLISAIHNSGLSSLTHTPSPMGFLNKILERPEQERPFLLLVVGYPADDAKVPDIGRKTLDEISTYF